MTNILSDKFFCDTNGNLVYLKNLKLQINSVLLAQSQLSHLVDYNVN